MHFKKAIKKIHLWLGLASGIIVIILGLTGCILAFEIEIRSLTEPFHNVQGKHRPFLPPSVLKAIAEKNLTSHKALNIEYPGSNKAAIAAYYDEGHYEILYLNPYTGALLRHKNMNKDFFRFVLDGHYYLWLPDAIGQPIAASATLIFLVMMITGIILWWPKNKAARKQRFTIKWNAKWRRRNYDLHNVLGFYMAFVTIFIALTGLVWGFQWFANSMYWITNGGHTAVAQINAASDTTKQPALVSLTDIVWARHAHKVPADESLSISFAQQSADVIQVTENHRPGTYYNLDSYYYDQYTGRQLNAKGTYAGRFKDAIVADKIARLNYDMHTGAVLGLPGKLLAFGASLIAASLPITGFLIWWGRRRKKKP